MDYLRQLDILDPRLILYPVTVIGCGGIGSIAALELACMGCPKLLLIDDDTVENHNRPSQLSLKLDINKPKVEAVKNVVNLFTDTVVDILKERFDGTQSLNGVVISGVDSMESRQRIWEKAKWNLEIPLYIDARTGGETIQVFTIRPCKIEDIEIYEGNLFGDEEAEELPCTSRAIMYTGFGIASIIGSQFKKWLKDESYARRMTHFFKNNLMFADYMSDDKSNEYGVRSMEEKR